MRKFSIIVLVFFCNNIVAQDACMALLNHGLYDEFIQKGIEKQYSSIQNEMCSAYQNYKRDVKSGGAKASYKMFKGKASFSSEKIEQVGKFLCEVDFSVDDAYQNRQQLSKQLNPYALDAFTQCVDSNKNRNLTVKTDFGNEAGDTIYISMSYNVRGSSNSNIIVEDISFKEERFDCSGPLFDLWKNKKNLTNSVKSLRCIQKLKEPFDHLGSQYYALSGDISITTGDSIVVRRLPSIGVPQPEEASADLFPVGTIISNTIPPDVFLSGEVPNINPSKWVVADGRSIVGSQLEEISNQKQSTNMEPVKNTKVTASIVNKTFKHGENVRNTPEYVENKNANWNWIASNKSTAGSRNGVAPGHYEWSEDHFEHHVNKEGKVIARGRTYDWKSSCGYTPNPAFNCDGWAKWRNGVANVLGIATYEMPEIYYYQKID